MTIRTFCMSIAQRPTAKHFIYMNVVFGVYLIIQQDPFRITNSFGCDARSTGDPLDRSVGYQMLKLC